MRLGSWSLLSGNDLLEIFADSTLDFVILDLEHGHHKIQSLSTSVALLKFSGKSVIVRMVDPGLQELQRCYDQGVDFIQVSGIRELEDCKRIAEKMALLGWSPWVRRARLPNLPEPRLIFQIEFEDIFLEFSKPNQELPKADFFLGRYDLSKSMKYKLGSAADYSNLEVFLSRCSAFGNEAWVVSTGNEDFERLRDMGFKNVSLGSDVLFLRNGLSQTLVTRDGERE